MKVQFSVYEKARRRPGAVPNAWFALLALLLVSAGAWGQEFRATLVGRVVDPTNAAVAGANVVVTQIGTNVLHRAVTTDTGDYAIPFLPPGEYRLEVERDGFRKFTREGISLRVQDRVSIDVTLALGTQTESVTVSGESPLLDTSSASVGQIVSEHAIQDLPLNGRNAYALMTTTPGVQMTVKDPTISFMRYSAAGDTGGIAMMSISGAPSTYNEYLLDGVPIGSDNNAVDYVPSIEATQEFKLQTNSFDAEYGRFLGGVVNSSIRSGVNEFHGNAFEYMRNSVWNARDFFATSKPQFSYNQFGASLSGPVYLPKLYSGKNRTFFFVMYDGSREGVPRSWVSTVPTALERSGDFSQTYASVNGQAVQKIVYDPNTTRLNGTAYVRDPFPGNVVPSTRQDPVAKALLGLYPLPSAPGNPITQVNNYPLSYKDPVLDNGVVFKVDHQISDHHQLFVRYFWRHFAVRGGGNFMSTDPNKATTTGHVNRYTPGVAVGHTWTLNPSTVLDFRYGYSRYSAVIISDSYGFDLSSLGWPSSMTKSIDVPVIPALSLSGYTGYGSYSLAKSAGDTHFAHAGISKQAGRHSLRTGFDVRLYRHNSGPGGTTSGTYNFTPDWTLGPNPQVTSATTGSSVASMLLGLGSSGSISYLASLARQAPYYEMYFQDDIRLTSKLTVNLGIRYEVEGGMTERYNRMNRGFDVTAASPIEAQAAAAYASNPIAEVPASAFRVKGGLLFAGQGGMSRSIGDTDFNNVSPRVGFAYTLTPKTILRGGYGHFFGPIMAQYYTAQACASCDTTPSYGNTAVTSWVTGIGLTPGNTLSNPF
ncbi:MAG TPA: TonB-dependent receptor, partial [Bryobacteraceae bacterium]|nr:TonB-dependent receptor [Bryobacteraceae bacterium]